MHTILSDLPILDSARGCRRFVRLRIRAICGRCSCVLDKDEATLNPNKGYLIGTVKAPYNYVLWARLTVGLNVVFYHEDVNKLDKRIDEWIGTRRQMTMTNIDRAAF